MNILHDHHQSAQVALGHPNGDEISRILSLIEWFLGYVLVMVTGQAKEQVVGVFPRHDDNPFENDIIDQAMAIIQDCG